MFAATLSATDPAHAALVQLYRVLAPSTHAAAPPLGPPAPCVCMGMGMQGAGDRAHPAQGQPCRLRRTAPLVVGVWPSVRASRGRLAGRGLMPPEQQGPRCPLPAPTASAVERDSCETPRFGASAFDIRTTVVWHPIRRENTNGVFPRVAFGSEASISAMISSGIK